MSLLRQKYQTCRQLLPCGISSLFILTSTWPSFRYALYIALVICEYSNFERKSLLHLLQAFDVPVSLLASTLVAMEMTVNCLMKLGDYPRELLEKVH